MSAMASQITGVLSVSSTVCSGTDQRKHQSSASLAFVRGIHRWLVFFFHKRPVTQNMYAFDDVIMSRNISDSAPLGTHCYHFNTSPSEQNCHHFTDDIVSCIFMDKKIRILIQISLNFVPTGPINNKPALVQVMAWHRTGDRPLFELQWRIYTALGEENIIFSVWAIMVLRTART